VGRPDHLGQTNYTEICIVIAKKYISKVVNKIQITCHVYVNYVFQILVFQLLDNSANRHAEKSRFFSCFTAAVHAVWLKTPSVPLPYLQILATPLVVTVA